MAYAEGIVAANITYYVCHWLSTEIGRVNQGYRSRGANQAFYSLDEPDLFL